MLQGVPSAQVERYRSKPNKPLPQGAEARSTGTQPSKASKADDTVVLSKKENAEKTLDNTSLPAAKLTEDECIAAHLLRPKIFGIFSNNDVFTELFQDAVKADATAPKHKPKERIAARLWVKTLLGHTTAAQKNALDENGVPPINYAVASGKKKLVDLLEAHGVKKSPSEEIEAAHRNLWNGIFHKKKELISQAISVPGFDANCGDLFMDAIHTGNADAIHKLLAIPGVNVHAQNAQGNTKLTMALQHGGLDTKTVKHLIQYPGTNVNHVNKKGKTGLMLASEQGKTEFVQDLLKHPKIDVNVTDPNGETALLRAIAKGRQEVIQVLVNHSGINLNYMTPQGETALMQAVQLNQPETVRALLAHPEIDVNQANQDGYTALMHAAINEDPQMLKFLLDHPDIQINQKANDGNTALFGAVGYDSPAAVEALLSKPQLDVNHRNQDGKTALQWAKAQGNKQIETLLRKHGATD